MFERRVIPQAKFTNADILIALKIIEKEDGIGRKLLSKKIFLNEASIRSILSKLKEMDTLTLQGLAKKSPGRAGIFLKNQHNLGYLLRLMPRSSH